MSGAGGGRPGNGHWLSSDEPSVRFKNPKMVNPFYVLLLSLLLVLVACGKPKPVESIETLKLELEAKDEEIKMMERVIKATEDQYAEERNTRVKLAYCRDSVDLLIESVDQETGNKLPRTLGYAVAKAIVLMGKNFILDDEEDYDEIKELANKLSTPKEEAEEEAEEEQIEEDEE